MPVVGIMNKKGGCGKTSLAINVARGLSLSGKKILLIDADQQQSSLNWYEAGGGVFFPVVGLFSPIIHKVIDSHKKNFDWIVIDAPPSNESIHKSIFWASDLVIVPLCPSPLDNWATESTVLMIRDQQELYDISKSYFVITKTKPQTNSSKEVMRIANGYKLPTFETVMTLREDFSSSFKYGQTIFETKNKDGKSEILNIISEIRGVIYGSGETKKED